MVDGDALEMRFGETQRGFKSPPLRSSLFCKHFNRLPRFRDQLLPKSVRTQLQGSDILFGNFESSLTNTPYVS